MSEKDLDKLIEELKSDDREVHKVAYEALGEIGESAVEPLIKALGDGNTSAVRALGEIGDARAVEPLIGVLRDENWWVRSCAAEALGKIGDTRAVEPLIKELDGYREDSGWEKLDVVASVIDALGEIGDSNAFEPLERLLRTSHNWNDPDRLSVRCRVARALSLFGSESVYTLASELENEYHGEAIDQFILALDKAGESSIDEYEKKVAAEAILTVLRNTEPNVRFRFDDRLRLAAQALGNIGHQVALEPLREKLTLKQQDQIRITVWSRFNPNLLLPTVHPNGWWKVSRRRLKPLVQQRTRNIPSAPCP